MSAQVVGYFDPVMIGIAGEIGRLLRLAFGTSNGATFPISGTGTAGMEAALINMLEPGDTLVVGHTPPSDWKSTSGAAALASSLIPNTLAVAPSESTPSSSFAEKPHTSLSSATYAPVPATSDQPPTARIDSPYQRTKFASYQRSFAW